MWQIVPKRWVRKSASSPDPNQGCSLSRGPLLPGHHAGGRCLPGPSAQDSLQSHPPGPLPRVLIHPTRQSTLLASGRGGEGLQNHSESGEGGAGPAHRGTGRASCCHPAPLLSKLPKFTVPELKLSSQPPSARHDGRAYFTRRHRDQGETGS